MPATLLVPIHEQGCLRSLVACSGGAAGAWQCATAVVAALSRPQELVVATDVGPAVGRWWVRAGCEACLTAGRAAPLQLNTTHMDD